MVCASLNGRRPEHGDANLRLVGCIRRGKRKWLHRQVCRNFLPARILKRKKRGFAVNVVDGWFNASVEGQLSDLLTDPNSRMYQLLNPVKVHKLLQDHRTGRHDNHKVLFSLVMLEQWLRSGQPSESTVLSQGAEPISSR